MQKKVIESSLKKDIIIEIVKFVDEAHCKGKSVTARKFCASLYEKYKGMEMPNSIVSPTMKRIGLTWVPIGRVKRRYTSYRANEIKKYLIGLHKNIQEMKNNTSNKIFVFTNESYINVNYGYKKVYLPQNKEQDSKLIKNSGKGVVIHYSACHHRTWSFGSKYMMDNQ